MDYVYIGRVAGTHGVQGAVKVFPTTDDVTRYSELKKVILEDLHGHETTYTVVSVKYQAKFVIVKFKEIEDMDTALKLKQSIVKVDKTQAIPLEEDEYFIQDLIGLKVVTDKYEVLGELVDVIFTGSNDVYVVKMQDDQEILLPAIHDCVLKIDLKNSMMTVHVMEGLL